MSNHQATDTGMRFHGTILCETDTNLPERQESVKEEVQTGIRQGGITHGGTDALECLSMEFLHRQMLIRSIAPDGTAYLLMEFLGCCLSKTVSKQLHLHLLIRVVVEISLHPPVDSSSENTDMVVLRMDEVCKAETVAMLLTEEWAATRSLHTQR